MVCGEATSLPDRQRRQHPNPTRGSNDPNIYDGGIARSGQARRRRDDMGRSTLSVMLQARTLLRGCRGQAGRAAWQRPSGHRDNTNR